MSVRYLSLFSGIEAASAAWEPLGWQPVAFAEIEQFPSALLAQRYPGVTNLGDVSAVDWVPYRGKVDVVVGGSPCQAFSVAGLRKSLEDPRGNLTLEYCRAVHAIRPRYAVWENVPGVVSTSDNAFGCFLAALVGADEAIETEEGWPSAGMVSGPAGRAAWRLLDAQWFGLAQRRLRVFVIFCPGGGGNPGEVLFERPRLLGNPPPRRTQGQGVAHGVAGSLGASGRGVSRGGESRGQDPVIAVPDVGFALNAKGGGGRIDGESETFVAEVDIAGGSSRTYVGVRRLTVTECERLMGLPDGWTAITFRGKPAADGPRYKALGNSMAVPVMRWIGERIEKLERAK